MKQFHRFMGGIPQHSVLHAVFDRFLHTMTDPERPRVVFLPDSFHEVNGVANTSRQFEAYARRRNLPFLCIRAGHRTPALVQDGSVWTLELPRGFLAFDLEKDLRFDPAFFRHFPLIEEALERFAPDLIHITGPSELGLLGVGIAHRYGLPLAASWHTNVHEYLARRSGWLLRRLPQRQAAAAADKIEALTLSVAAFLYRSAGVLFAPTPAFCTQLSAATGRPCHVMSRGVDAELFNPSKRQRQRGDDDFVLGFVGRLSVEKNVALLAEIQRILDKKNKNFRFCIVGHGKEESWLRTQLPRAEFTGVLRGEELARAYADMDLFIFPSHTDTFGNVVLEALASGVPAIVTPDGGPPTIVRDGVTGRVATDDQFASEIERLIDAPEELSTMRSAARTHAVKASWEAVFDSVYAAYEGILPHSMQKKK